MTNNNLPFDKVLEAIYKSQASLDEEDNKSNDFSLDGSDMEMEVIAADLHNHEVVHGAAEN